MKIPFLSKRQEPGEPAVKAYFVLRITTTQLQAALWETGPGGPEVVATSEYLEWDPTAGESLVGQADEALGQISEHLPEKAEEPRQILFGVPSHWVADGQPLPTYRDLLKSVVKELGLTALGFAVTSEAVVNLLNQREPAPITAIIVGIDAECLEFSLTFQGKVQQVEVVKRETDIVESFKVALSKFPAAAMPARMVLFDGGQSLGEVHATLTHFGWHEADLGFSHPPKIEMLPEKISTMALIGAANPEAEQVATEVADRNQNEESALLEEEIPLEEAKAETMEEADEKLADTANTEAEEAAGEDDKEEDSEATEELGVEGFVMGKDIREVTESQPMVRTPAAAMPRLKHPPAVIEGENLKTPPPGRKEEAYRPPAPTFKRPPMKLPKIPVRWVVLPLIALAILGGGLWLVMSRTSAQIQLLVEPQLLENNFTVTVDPQASEPNQEAGVLPGKVLTAEGTGKKSAPTSGTKTVGDAAKGEVTIYNDTDSARELAAGTTIANDKGMKFTLDQEVKIASKSVDLASSSPYKPGSAKVKVTAAKIGAESNLEANTSFTVANFSQTTILARNEAAFSGGTSKEAKGVSKADVEKLTKDLVGELESQALEKLNGQVASGNQLVTASLTSKTKTQEFDHKVDEEADVLSLTLTSQFSGVSFSTTEFNDLVKKQLSTKVPTDKQLAEDSKVEFKPKEDASEGSYVFEVATQSFLLPKLNPENIQNKVKGNAVDSMKVYLLSLPSVRQIKVEVKPKLPGILNRFPFKSEKISITIEPMKK